MAYQISASLWNNPLIHVSIGSLPFHNAMASSWTEEMDFWLRSWDRIALIRTARGVLDAAVRQHDMHQTKTEDGVQQCSMGRLAEVWTR